MTERWETLYKGASRAAWGYLFFYLDIKLGTVSILPRFVSYLLFLSAIRCLSTERRNLILLRPLGILRACWSGADWLASWLGTTLDGRFPPLDLIVGAAALYFHFQLLTDCAALAATCQPPDGDLDQRLLRWRTVQTILITLITLSYYPSEFWGSVWSLLPIPLMISSGVVTLFLMSALFSLRKLFVV